MVVKRKAGRPGFPQEVSGTVVRPGPYGARRGWALGTALSHTPLLPRWRWELGGGLGGRLLHPLTLQPRWLVRLP